MSDTAPPRRNKSRAGRGWIAAALLLAASLGVHADAALKDPTRPPTIQSAGRAVATRAAFWRLTSTLISPERRIAVINRRIVEAGQRVGGALVVWIGPGRVRLRLRHNDREFMLRLLPRDVKTPVSRDATPAGGHSMPGTRRQGGGA